MNNVKQMEFDSSIWNEIKNSRKTKMNGKNKRTKNECVSIFYTKLQKLAKHFHPVWHPDLFSIFI